MKISKLLKSKKGQLGTLQNIVISLVVIGLVLGLGFLVLEEYLEQIETSATLGTAAASYQGVNKTIDALTEIPEWLDIVVILAIISILLYIIFAVFPRGAGGEGTTI